MDIGLKYAVRSDVGLVRANNQDSAYAGPHLLMIADGMGGHAGGDVASSLAIAAFAPLDDEAHGLDDALAELERAMEAAREQIVARTQAEPELAGMGTTVTAILRAENKLAMAHLGDSRGYLLHDGALTQVTVDHTFVQHLVDTGKIRPEEAEHHPQRSVVMRVLGDFDVDVTPDLSVREARPGDRWLLCSDGLSGFVSHDTIEATLDTVRDLDACADRLVQLALRGGGGDNVTVIVADIVNLADLPDGTAPANAVTVVGAAASSRNRPTVAADGPAARAARLLHRTPPPPPAPVADDESEPIAGPRARTLFVVWGIALGLVVLLLAGGYVWTQSQYYVGEADGNVAVFRGLPTGVGSLALSRVVERSDVVVDTLPDYLRQRVADTIHAASLDDARHQVTLLAGEVAPAPVPTFAPSPLPTFTVGPEPTFTVGPQPTFSVVPAPSALPGSGA
ncbi:MAG: protein phosphatase 2C domain-containing protein [Micrococcales bacterium]|nr:protein phosphatase 2C domain-containing protein [Micrococcales bacterium]